MQVKIRQSIERAIVARLVKDAVSAGYFVSLDNGDEPDHIFTVDPTQDVQKVLANIAQTDQDHIFLSKDGQQRKGFKVWFFLVYGNDGPDVINDYSANDEAEAIIKGANALAEDMENRNMYMSTFDPEILLTALESIELLIHSDDSEKELKITRIASNALNAALNGGTNGN